MIAGRGDPSKGCFLGMVGVFRGGGGVVGEGCWVVGGIPPKDILFVNRVKSTSHSARSGTTLTRHYCCCGDDNGVGRDPMAPMVVVTSLVFVGTRSGGNTIYARFEWLLSAR